MNMNILNTLISSQTGVFRGIDLQGWVPTIKVEGHGETSGNCIGSMAEVSVPQSPRHLHKRRRLSQLLDKLAVQIRNNNNNNNQYTASQWLMVDPPFFEPNKAPQEDLDLPLDLSVKSEPVQSLQDNEQGAYVCPTCGQTFTVHDRLAKHVASRHRNRTPESARAYECDICRRRFARSDMLTRHARLHSGVKPYSCSACGQVFSRSDHLATHQRTHTGEKPYRCPSCPYAACRRDMITRHMRTHTRRPLPA